MTTKQELIDQSLTTEEALWRSVLPAPPKFVERQWETPAGGISATSDRQWGTFNEFSLGLAVTLDILVNQLAAVRAAITQLHRYEDPFEYKDGIFVALSLNGGRNTWKFTTTVQLASVMVDGYWDQITKERPVLAGDYIHVHANLNARPQVSRFVVAEIGINGVTVEVAADPDRDVILRKYDYEQFWTDGLARARELVDLDDPNQVALRGVIFPHRHGGSWDMPPQYSRSTWRGFAKPGSRSNYLGFRVCVSPEDRWN